MNVIFEFARALHLDLKKEGVSATPIVQLEVPRNTALRMLWDMRRDFQLHTDDTQSIFVNPGEVFQVYGVKFRIVEAAQ